MSADTNPIFGDHTRTAGNNALEESGLLGPHRRCTNINKFEVIFLISALLAALVTDGLTIYRLAELPDTTDSDFAYGIIILVTSVFLLIFLATGIFQQRITDIIVFFICALMMTIYVIAHYVYRLHEKGTNETPTDETLRLVRLIFTCVFNVLFVPLSIIVIRDYERDEFGKRLFGAFAEARRPLRIYNVLDCIARINAMLSISVYLLNLYNFNEYRAVDTILLCIGIPLSFLWLGFTIGMIRMESYLLVGFFIVISFFQPGFLIYCIISDFVDTSPSLSSSSTTTAPIIYNTTAHNETEIMMPNFFLSNDSLMLLSTSPPSTAASIPIALYLCMAFNFLSHIGSFVLGMLCVKNFGRGLKEKVFNNQMDKFFRPYFSKS